MKKLLLTSILLGTMLLSSVGASAMTNATGLEDFTGWHTNRSGQTAYYIKGDAVKDGVIQKNNNLYYFDSNGFLMNGTYNFKGTTATFRDGLFIKCIQ